MNVVIDSTACTLYPFEGLTEARFFHLKNAVHEAFRLWCGLALALLVGYVIRLGKIIVIILGEVIEVQLTIEALAEDAELFTRDSTIIELSGKVGVKIFG